MNDADINDENDRIEHLPDECSAIRRARRSAKFCFSSVDLFESADIHPVISRLSEFAVRHISFYCLPTRHLTESVDVLKRHVRANDQLESLQLLDTRLGNEVVGDLLQALYRHKTLQMLDVEGNRLDDCGTRLCDLIRRNKSIKRLDLCHNDLSISTQGLADGLMMNSTLTTIRLVGCHLTDANFLSIATALMVSKQSVLHTLDLRGNRLTFTSLRRLLQAVHTRGCIQNIMLGHNRRLFEEDEHSWRYLVGFLRHTTTPVSLERLDIHACNVPNEAVMEIFRSLEDNRFLKHLSVDISDAAGIEQVLQSLPKLSIQSLAFQDYFTENAGAIEDRLVEAVSKNRSLWYLRYSSPEFDLSHKAEVAMDCITGRNNVDKLMQSRPPPSLWPLTFPFFGRVGGRVGPSMLFYGLRSNLQYLIPENSKKRRRGNATGS